MNGTPARLLAVSAGIGVVLLGLLTGWAFRNRESAAKVPPDDARSGRQAGSVVVSQLGGSPTAESEEEALIRAVLSDQSIDHSEAAHRLFTLVADASRPLKRRQQALTHALNLVSEADYKTELGPILLSPGLPEPLAEAIWTNLHERPDELQLDLAKALAAQSGHPLQEDAMQLLRTFPGVAQE